jgi:hypothetical protein
MNDIANLCELVGADIQDVAKGMSFDERIGSKSLNAGIGFGGSCFPKDTKALEYLARQHGYELRTVKAAIDVNNDQKTMLYKKACRRLITFNRLKVAVLGLTFKPGTDDLREAPSLENVPLLLEQGAEVFAYDPVGMENFKKKYPEGGNGRGSIKYVDRIEEALKGANELMAHTYSHLYKIIATGLRFFTVYGPMGRPDMAYFGFANRYFAGKPIKIFNNGDFENDLYRDFTYIDDIIEGIERLLGNAPAGIVPHKVFNIGNNSPEKLMVFIETLEKCLSKATGREVVFDKVFEPIKPGDVPATYASTDLLQEAIEFKPETSIEEGLQRFADWYVEYYGVKK